MKSVRRQISTAVGGLLLGLSLSAPALADAAVGTWRLSDGRVTVSVKPCGEKLCGYIVALAEPLDKQGKPKVDHENPNPSLRSRPVIGIQVLSIKAKGADSWAGSIYNADDGGTYSARLKLKGSSQMQLKACLGPFCKNRTFLKVN